MKFMDRFYLRQKLAKKNKEAGMKFEIQKWRSEFGEKIKVTDENQALAPTLKYSV